MQRHTYTLVDDMAWGEEQKAAPKPNAAHALKANTYDALTWAATRWCDPQLQEHLGKCHLFVGLMLPFLLNMLSIVLQVGMIFCMVQFTIERRADVFEREGDLPGKTILFHQAVATKTPLDGEKHKHLLEMCHDDHNVPYTQSVMTCLWGMKLLPSVSQSIWMISLKVMLPNPAPGHPQLIAAIKDKLGIIQMPSLLKALCLLVADVPRLFVAIYLYWMGAQFLMYAPSLGVLIMKSIGLSFISTIPELLFAGLSSEAVQKDVGRAQLSYYDRAHDGANRCMDHWDLWGATVTKFFVLLIVTLIYCRILCADIQNWREACTSYKYTFILPDCPQCGSHLLGLTFYN